MLKRVKLDVQPFEDATELPSEWLDENGCIYCNTISNNYNGYMRNWDEVFDSWYWHCKASNLDETLNRPEFAYATNAIHGLDIDIDIIIEDACCDLYDEAIEDISDVTYNKLAAAIKEFNENSGVGTTYTADFTQKVRIPWQKYDEYTHTKISTDLAMNKYGYDNSCQCPNCGKFFDFEGYLHKHDIQCYGEDEEARIKCPKCDVYFTVYLSNIAYTYRVNKDPDVKIDNE